MQELNVGGRCVHAEDERERRQRRTLVDADVDGEGRRCSDWAADDARWVSVEELNSSDIRLGDDVQSERVPYEFVRDSVECRLEIQEGNVDGQVFLPVPLQKQPGCVDSVRCPAAADEAALVLRQGDELSNSGIEDPLEDLHGMTEKADRSVGSLRSLRRRPCPSKSTL